ncbi:FKBP-type peptidyl-prolyl cis-trans isomerase [Faecalibacter bovis]|uniref:Peptidyl-prolyl cis-trans isomerase n=1 Tax=Faecalibacter bovis TaxID=2898187 RepID=A0ABX7XEP9_9FLAO|nr:FKBP-type peptidyl-prolyl cis-trans isomerase [Faecalibacter bovis]MBS7333624.1 FKBP-type peptidyl-prolyl cis-trans isomerase [Weeksellaceae bacterium]QTV06272.1 FKBP-type peptidyl-prolyl cis-trans isomerase [Faecalibacter bovis]
MKKILVGIFVVASLVSCNKGKTVEKLDNDDQKASYAFGVGLGEGVKQMSARLVESDSIDYAQLEKGLKDYLNGSTGRESYSIGQQMGQQIETVINQQQLDQLDKDIIVQGIMDVVRHKKLLITQEAGMGFLDTYAQNHMKNTAKKNAEESKKLVEAKKGGKAKATASGLVYEVVKEGTGAKPNANSIVKVKYTGKLLKDGKVFDSTEKNNKGEAVEFPLNAVIPGWSEGLQLMSKGGVYKFYIPSELGYGEQGAPGGQIGPNQALEFEVELVDFKEGEPAPAPSQGGGLTEAQLQELQKQFEAQAQQGK